MSSRSSDLSGRAATAVRNKQLVADSLSSKDYLGCKPENIKRSPIEVRLKLDQCDPDPQTCPENASVALGSYSVTGKGLYQVRLVAQALDGNGQTIRREQMRTLYFAPDDPFPKWYWWLLLIIVLVILLLLFVRVIKS